MFDEEAQLHTLEGVAASALLLMVIVYAIDATSTTPLLSSTSGARVESELRGLGEDIFNALDYAEPGYNSKLKNDIINWNGKEYLWNGTKYMESGATYSQNNLTNNLTELLSSTLVRQGIVHKVEVTYLISANNITLPSASVDLIHSGAPSNNAVIVSRKLVLHDTDITVPGNPIQDIDPTTSLYNIVDIELVLWRM